MRLYTQVGVILLLVKSIRVGNSIAIPLPKEMNIQENQSYFLIQDENGTISLIPKTESMYEILEDGALYQQNLLDENQKGKEII